MKTHPHRWSHHHTHRLYHISLLAVFAFALGFAVYGIFWVLGSSLADNSQSTTSAVSATIEEIAPGTSTPVSTVGLGPLPTPASAPSSTPAFIPTIELFPANISKQFDFGASGKVFVLTTSRPVLFGKTNIDSAEIILQISSSTQAPLFITLAADPQGNFNWQAQQDLPDGAYEVQATATSPVNPSVSVETAVTIYISTQVSVPPSAVVPLRPASPTAPVPSGPAASARTPLVFLKISPNTRQVRAGQTVVARLTLQGFGAINKPARVEVEFFITNYTGTVFPAGTETFTVAGRAAFDKDFYAASDARAGEYTITAKVSQPKYTLLASDSFTVRPTVSAAMVPGVVVVDLTRSVDGFTFLGCLFLLLVYYEYRRIHHHSRVIKDLERVGK